MKTGSLYRILFNVESVVLLCFLLLPLFSFSQKTWDAGGDGVNWSSAANWNPDGVPANTDDVTIASGQNITVDMAAVCASLTIGDGTNANASVTLSGANTLNITTAGGGTGNLSLNPINKPKTYSLIVGAGAVTVAGAFTSGMAGGKGCIITISTGSISFTSITAFTFPKGVDLTITGVGGSALFTAAFTLGAASAAEGSTLTLQAAGSFTFNGLVTLSDADNIMQNTTIAGTFNFNAGFTLSAGGTASFVTMAGTTVKFGGNFTVSGVALIFNSASTAEFNANTPTITPTAAITFGNVLLSGGTATLAGNIAVVGNWTNTGGALTAAGFTVTFSGTANTIGGTTLTAFGPIVIAAGAVYTMDNSNSCTGLTFTASGTSSSFTHGVSNPLLTISGNLTMNQPSAAVTSSWNINGGSATVSGTIAFVGGNTTAGTVGRVAVTTGSLTANGAVNFASNTTDANQIITVTGSGSATFASSVITTAQADLRDGTLSVTGNGSMIFSSTFTMTGGTVLVSTTGTLTFNGAPAFSYNTGSIPTVTNFSGSTFNFNGNLTTLAALIFTAGSNEVFTGVSTITPTAAVTFANLQINSGITVTLAGNIAVTGNWTNSGGTFNPATYAVTFNGTGTQTITKAGSTETFYGLTSNTTGPLTIGATTDVTVTNTLTMTAGNYNLNGRTLTLGNGGVATLVRTAGIMYGATGAPGGTFKRYLAIATAVSSTAAPLYGLFPMGTATEYRPVEINSTANPTAGGYVSVSHTDPLAPNFVTDVTYTDNEGDAIQRISNIISTVSTSGGFAGGTYVISVTYTQLSGVGILTDLKLETYTAATMGSVGVTVATGGSVSAPVGKRSGLTAANLANDFVIGTKDKSPLGTPIRQYYYSRKNGNWNDVTAGNGTWSYTSGGAGPSCDCLPVSDGYAIISDGQTVSVSTVSAIDYVLIGNIATLDGTAAFTVNKDLTTAGSGKFTPTAGAWTISRNLTMVGTGSSSLSGTSTVTGILNVGAGTILTMNGGVGLTVTDNLIVDGTLALSTSTLTLNGSSGKTISGSTGAASITGAGATISVTTANKTISAGTNLIIAPVFAITGAITVTNNGTVTLSGNLTGSAAGSTWTNAAGSTLNAAGTVLATGILDASASPTTVNYNGAGAQTIKTPSSSTYYNLTCSNAGTKSLAADVSVTNLVTIQNAAILDEAAAATDLTGAGGLTMTGTSELIVHNSTNNLTEPELTGAYALTGGTVTITSNHGGGGNYCAVRGAVYYNLNLNGSNKHNLVAVSSITNNLTVGGSVNFSDNAALTVGGATAYSSSGSSTLNNNLTSGSVTLSAGTFDDGGKTITITGSGWTRNGGTFTKTGTVSFTGTAAQTIGGSVSTTFNNLTINNTFPTTAITLAAPITVNGTLALTDGHIVTDATNLLTMAASATASLGATPQDSSFVKGPMAHTVNVSTAVTKVYPIGKDNDYRRVDVTIDQSATTSTTYKAELKNTSAKALGHTVPGSIDWVSDMRYYEVTQSPATGLDAASQRMRIYFQCTERGDVVQELSSLRVAQWDGATAWVDRVGTAAGAICSGINYAGDILSDPFNNFTGNLFSLANATGGANPLPVELLNFSAAPVPASKVSETFEVLCKWETASEFNSDYFEVQRKGGMMEDWKIVGTVKGAGNSSAVKDYSLVDHDPYRGISYYRLKQVDNNGKFSFSAIASVNIDISQKEKEISVYPNPATGPFNVGLTGWEGKEVLIVVRDIQGREFYSKVVVLTDDQEVIAIDPFGKLASGLYFVIASSDNGIFAKRIVIK